MGILRHIRVSKKSQINLFTDSAFISLWKMINALYCKLHSQGIGCSVNKTETLTDEDKLWQLGILNPETSHLTAKSASTTRKLRRRLFRR